MTTPAQRLIRAADLTGTFVFAIEGALAAIAAGFDPIGVLALALLTALGGGMIRDVLIGATPVAAVCGGSYMVIVLIAAAATAIFHPARAAIPDPLLITLDAAGLALFAVAGTEKSLHHGIPRLPAIFLGTISGVGGGTIRDVLLNVVPTVLRADVYATAALVAAILVVTGRTLRLPPAVTGIIAALACFGLRMAAVAYDWQLPRPN